MMWLRSEDINIQKCLSIRIKKKRSVNVEAIELLIITGYLLNAKEDNNVPADTIK